MGRELELSNHEFLSYLARTYFAYSHFHENSADKFVVRVTDPKYFAPLVYQKNYDPEHIEILLEREPNHYFSADQLEMLNALKAMKPQQVGALFDGLLESSGIVHWGELHAVGKLYTSQKSEKLAPIVWEKRGEYRPEYSNMDGTSRNDFDRELQAITRNGDPRQVTFDWSEPGSSLRRVVVPPSALAESEREKYDFTHAEAIARSQKATQKFETDIAQLSDQLLEIARQPEIAKERVNNLRNHFPDERILTEELKRQQRAIPPGIPPELQDNFRSMDILRGMANGDKALWRLKGKKLNTEEFFRFFDPDSPDSPLRQHLDTQPPGTQREIRNIIQYMQRHPEMVEKYGTEGLIDQFNEILRSHVLEQIKDNPKGPEIEGFLYEYYRGSPSGARCVSCDEEVKRNYQSMKEAVIVAQEIAPFHQQHNSKDTATLLSAFRNHIAGKDGNLTLS